MPLLNWVRDRIQPRETPQNRGTKNSQLEEQSQSRAIQSQPIQSRPDSSLHVAPSLPTYEESVLSSDIFVALNARPPSHPATFRYASEELLDLIRATPHSFVRDNRVIDDCPSAELLVQHHQYLIRTDICPVKGEFKQCAVKLGDTAHPCYVIPGQGTPNEIAKFGSDNYYHFVGCPYRHLLEQTRLTFTLHPYGRIIPFTIYVHVQSSLLAPLIAQHLIDESTLAATGTQRISVKVPGKNTHEKRTFWRIYL